MAPERRRDLIQRKGSDNCVGGCPVPDESRSKCPIVRDARKRMVSNEGAPGVEKEIIQGCGQRFGPGLYNL